MMRRAGAVARIPPKNIPVQGSSTEHASLVRYCASAAISDHNKKRVGGYMIQRMLLATLVASTLAGCGTPMALRETRTGGDASPAVRTDITGKPDLKAIGYGDTVAVSPGNMKAVFASTPLTYTLFEDSFTTTAELEKREKTLSVNRKDMPNLELLKAEMSKGMIRTNIYIRQDDPDPNKFDRTIRMIAINRGEKPFRGDLTIYDLMPPELQFVSASDATKLVSQQGVKAFLSVVPIVQYVTFAMDDYAKSDEKVPMTHAMLDQLHKYTMQRLVLDPGQAVGFEMKVRYIPPTAEELAELRETATPLQYRQR
uniref:Uncharacterized protein n=2 Tax=Burkholderiaceae TaxID=119060 RepID=Q46TH4_CUPPJ